MARLSGKTLKIALLNCERLIDHLPAPVYNKTGGYFELLQKTFDHVCSKGLSSGQLKKESEIQGSVRKRDEDLPAGTRVVLSDFDVKGGHFPEKPQSFDGVLISGSLSGVYDREDWIGKLLEQVIKYDQLGVRTCGISFGHQAIAEALGGKVLRNPKGTEVSVRTVQLNDAARKYFQTERKSFSLHYHHGDTVISLPPGFSSVGGNNVTQYQGLFKEDKFLAFCGHPDYSHTPEVLKALLEYDREKKWVHEELVEYGLGTLNLPTDYEWVTKQIILFYLGKRKFQP